MKRIQLWKGDCLELMKGVEDKSIDMILCDLPYGTTACKWDTIIPFQPLWKQYERIIKDNGVIVLFGSQPFTSSLVMSNPSLFRYRWAWDKIQGGNFQIAKLQPMNTIEDILVFSKGKSANGAKNKAIYYPQMTKHKKPVKSGGNPSVSNLLNKNSMVALGKTRTEKYPTSILTFRKPTNKERRHPTQKPVALLEYLVKTYTQEDEIVLDNCMGSGSTGVACININRRFLGMELDEKYFSVAEDRIKEHAQQLKLF